MRRALKIIGWIVGLLIAVPVALIALVLVAANTDPGRAFIAREVGRLSGGTVVVDGLAGAFPTKLILRHVALRDTQGSYATAENLVFAWSPEHLLSRTLFIKRLTADRLHVLRLPVAPKPASPSQSSGTSYSLPVRVVLQRLHVGRLAIDAAVASAPATVSLDGDADIAAITRGRANLAVQRLDGAGTYTLHAALDGTQVAAALNMNEPAHGLVSGLAHLPELGALSVQARINGPMDALATDAEIAAGPLHASAKGTVNATGRSAVLDVSATAPAMAPRPDTSWQAVVLDAHVRGPFNRPDANGQLAILGLHAGGATLSSLVAKLQGNAGQVSLTAVLDGIRVPGPQPDLLSSAPLLLAAQVRLDAADRPVAYVVSHPLLSVRGVATAGNAMTAAASVELPDLAPFAAIGGIPLQGHTTLTLHATDSGTTATAQIDGTLGLTGGMAPAPALIGPNATYHAVASLQGQTFTISRAEVNGQRIRLNAQGADDDGRLDLTYAADLSDLAAIAPTVSGNLAARGTVQGAQTDLTVAADLSGEVGAPGVPRGPLRASLRAQGLPGAPTGQITAQGTLAGAPLDVAAQVSRGADGTMHAAITRADWKSAHIGGDFTLARGATLPTGQAQLRMTRLDDLAPFIGQRLSGSINATADLGANEVTLQLTATDTGTAAGRVGRAVLQARVADPATHPVVTAQLTTEGISASGVGGSARVDVSGPQDALTVRASADLTGLAGAPARIVTAAVVNATVQDVTVQSLTADWHDEALRLLAPVRIAAKGGISVDRLRLGIGTATLDVAGRVSPTLDLTVALHGVTPALVKPFDPTLNAAGRIDADARLTGTTARPAGTVRLTATGMRLLSGPTRSLPAANLTASLDLAGTTARLNAQVAAGTTRLAVAGPIPLSATGPLDLRTSGRVDLALTDPILTPQGRRARGTVTLDLTVNGTAAAPRFGGTVQIAGGDVQDYAQGAHLTNIAGTIVGEGDTLRITNLVAHAGTGTITISGTIGALAPQMPVDLTIAARNAQPIASDLLTADFDADVTVRGQVAGALSTGGTIRIRRADINIPDKLPSSVATLNVRWVGQPPPPPSSPPLPIALDLTLSAPQQVFVRGHGLNAEMGGRMHIGGTAAAPQITGGFQLRYGTFSFAGTTLTFSRGVIGFNGAGLFGKLDPSLDFQADSTANNITASIIIGGYADKPTFKLTSSPQLPQDEILAHLLFGTSVKDLGPFQYAQIAQALASLSGSNSPLTDPLSAVRQGLGLDRLNVNGGSNGAGPSVEGGKYVAPGVFVGAKQGSGGGTNSVGSQAEVQIDLWKGLKLNSTAGSGQGSNSVGLSYEFNY